MISNNALISAWSYALVGIAYLFFLLKIIQNSDENLGNKLSNRVLSLAILFTILWGLVELGNMFFKNRLLIIVGDFFDFMRYLFWCIFIISILNINTQSLKYFNIFLGLITVIYVLLLIALLKGLYFYFENTAALADFIKIFRLVFSIFSLVLIEKLFFGVVSDDRWKLKPMAIGLSSIFIFDLYLYSEGILFGNIDADAYAVRGFVHALVVPFLFISLASRSRNNFRFKLSKNTVLNSLALTLSGAYLITIASVGYYIKFFGGDWGRALQVALVYISLLGFTVVLFSNKYRSKIKVYIEKNFFHYIYDYREEWLKFTNVLASQNSELEMSEKIIKAFSNILNSPSGTLWVRKSKDGAFNQVAQINQKHNYLIEAAGSSLCRYMHSSGRVIDIEQYRLQPKIYGVMQLPDWVNICPNLWLIIPLLAGEELIGFCTLDKPKNPVSVNWEVNDLLKMAGRQAAGFLVQIQATEALLESRKFAAFNRMSAFVVHDLKNIVTQLSLMMRNSQRLLSNPEFQNDMLLTVDNSLVRMRQLMRQLHEGAASATPFAGVDVKVLLEGLVARAKQSGREIEGQFRGSAFVAGQADRLERVLGHLIQNALEATEAGGYVQVSLASVNGKALIVLRDTGCGMSPEFVATRLFKPFQTTKPHGMGIGAYECFQYVQELEGSIHVDSAPGAGTTLTLQLPLLSGSA